MKTLLRRRGGLGPALWLAVLLCGASSQRLTTPVLAFQKPFSPRRGQPAAQQQTTSTRDTAQKSAQLRQPHHLATALSTTGGEAATSDSNSNGGTATIPNEIFNLVKSIIGKGVLSLPAGIAAYGNAPSALLPAALLIAVMGGVSAFTFSLLARVCRLTGATSYADCWDRTHGKSTAWIVAASSALGCLAGNLSYSMVLADTFQALLAFCGLQVSRSHALLGLTSTVLLPLCLVKNLSTLAPFSLVGILGMAYTAVAIAIRYFDGSYAIKPAGRFLAHVTRTPSFGSTGAMGALSPQSLILICMLSTAYIAHFNAPKFYRELQNNTISRFNKVVAASFGISIAAYVAISALGFLTFGGATAGLLLNNYAATDALMSASRFAVALSLVFSYPLLFQGSRDGLLDLFRAGQAQRSDRMLNQLSIGLLVGLTGLALKITDLTLVASLSGAVLGTALIFIYPTLMFRAAVRNDPNKKWERRLCSWIAAAGVAIGCIGAKMSLQ